MSDQHSPEPWHAREQEEIMRTARSGHSPEPWYVAQRPPGYGFDGLFRIRDTTDHHVATVPSNNDASGKAVGDGPPNAARIVACVNAMAGIPDPQVFVDAARKAVDEYGWYYGTLCMPSGMQAMEDAMGEIPDPEEKP